MSNVTGMHVRSLQSLKSFCPKCFKAVTVSPVSKQPGQGQGGLSMDPPRWLPAHSKDPRLWVALPKPALCPFSQRGRGRRATELALSEGTAPRNAAAITGLSPGGHHPHPLLSSHHPKPSAGTAAAGRGSAITDLLHFNTDALLKNWQKYNARRYRGIYFIFLSHENIVHKVLLTCKENPCLIPAQDIF